MNHEDVDHLHKSSKAIDSLFSQIENLPLSKTIENHFKSLINDSSSPNKTLNEYSSTNTKVPTTRSSSVKPSKTVRKTTTKASQSSQHHTAKKLHPSDSVQSHNIPEHQANQTEKIEIKRVREASDSTEAKFAISVNETLAPNTILATLKPSINNVQLSENLFSSRFKIKANWNGR